MLSFMPQNKQNTYFMPSVLAVSCQLADYFIWSALIAGKRPLAWPEVSVPLKGTVGITSTPNWSPNLSPFIVLTQTCIAIRKTECFILSLCTDDHILHLYTSKKNKMTELYSRTVMLHQNYICITLKNQINKNLLRIFISGSLYFSWLSSSYTVRRDINSIFIQQFWTASEGFCWVI